MTTPALKGSRTEANLRAAFALECQTMVRYLTFAKKADVEGLSEAAAVFRSAADGEAGHAEGHLDFLSPSGDPLTGMAITDTLSCLASAIAGETQEASDGYPAMAKIAREEGFDDAAQWFETLAKAERKHAERFRRELEAPR